jgi:beta-galactosidase
VIFMRDRHAYYLGCDLNQAAMDKLISFLGKKAKLELNLYGIPGVEAVETTDGNKKALFIMNHNAYPVMAAIDKAYTEMLTGQVVTETVCLEPYGVAVLNEN